MFILILLDLVLQLLLSTFLGFEYALFGQINLSKYLFVMKHLQKVGNRYLHVFLVLDDQVKFLVVEVYAKHIPTKHVVWQITGNLLQVYVVLQEPETAVLASKDKSL